MKRAYTIFHMTRKKDKKLIHSFKNGFKDYVLHHEIQFIYFMTTIFQTKYKISLFSGVVTFYGVGIP